MHWSNMTTQMKFSSHSFATYLTLKRGNMSMYISYMFAHIFGMLHDLSTLRTLLWLRLSRFSPSSSSLKQQYKKWLNSKASLEYIGKINYCSFWNQQIWTHGRWTKTFYLLKINKKHFISDEWIISHTLISLKYKCC